MNKIKIILILLMTALCIFGCKNQNEVPEISDENTEETTSDTENEQDFKIIKLVPNYDWEASIKNENSFNGYMALESFLPSDYTRTVNIGDILTFHIKGKVSTNVTIYHKKFAKKSTLPTV